ncbi:MAG: lipopolysaccharide heptosyltransferase II [Gammaproteobacteria bacterium]|nr:lipopolysaccharide heptosyltransferase II [Gammaproteobacteria bacterium]
MPASASRLLVVMPSWVGDCVMATPLLRAIRRHYEAAGRETYMAAYLRPHLAPLFSSETGFDACIEGRPAGLLGPLREAGRLRRHGFDTALILPNSFRAALLTWLARVPRRIGYDRDGRGPLLTGRVPCPASGGRRAPVPLVEYYLKLAEPLGVEVAGDRSPRLAPRKADIALARGMLESRGVSPERPIALLNPGASKPGKRWPAGRFAALADLLHDRHGMQILINGAPNERELIQDVADRVEHAVILDLSRHDTTLAALAALCTLVDLVVTNDTGTRHIAAAVGFERLHRGEPAPGIVTIFGTVRPEWTTLNYPRERELVDHATGGVEGVSLSQVADACRVLLTPAPSGRDATPSN